MPTHISRLYIALRLLNFNIKLIYTRRCNITTIGIIRTNVYSIQQTLQFPA